MCEWFFWYQSGPIISYSGYDVIKIDLYTIDLSTIGLYTIVNRYMWTDFLFVICEQALMAAPMEDSIVKTI